MIRVNKTKLLQMAELRGIKDQQTLAQALRIHPSALSLILAGRREPRGRNMRKLLSWTGIPFGELFYYDGKEERNGLSHTTIP